MKKHAALLLALLFALSVSAPALAYTANAAEQQGVSPYTVDISLVEYTEGDQLSNWLSAPPADRGYAKNELIAAIGALTVPANHSVYGDYYEALIFRSNHVSLWVAENNPYRVGIWKLAALTSNMAASVPGWMDRMWFFDDKDDLVYSLCGETPAMQASRRSSMAGTVGLGGSPALKAIPVSSVEKTYRFLVFGKVTDNDASLTFSLSRYAFFSNAGWMNYERTFTNYNWPNLVPHISLAPIIPRLNYNDYPTAGMVLNEDLLVFSYYTPIHQTGGTSFDNFPRPYFAGPNVYFVFENSAHSLGFHIAFSPAGTPGQLLLAMETGARGKTERLYMYPHGAATGSTEYRVHVEPSTQELVFIITKYPPAGKALNDQIKFGTPGYNALLAFYKEWFEEKLGFSAYSEGNLLGWDDWSAIADASIDISATVELKPWAPYVSVPENIVSMHHS